MNTKELQLVTYGQAVRLKKLRFKWYTATVYAINPNDNKPELCDRGIAISHRNKIICSAPTVALALKWFRDEKNIVGYLYKSMYDRFCLSIYSEEQENYTRYKFDTYEAAESALLDALLTILEEEGK
jgi:hypothetical protein